MKDKIIERVLYGVDVPIFDRNGNILMLQRNVASEKFTTGWEFVKGGVKEGETYIQAALRETSEEAHGLKVHIIHECDREILIDARYRKKPHYDYVKKKVVILGALGDTTNITIDTREHSAYKRMNYDEAREKIRVEDGKRILENAKKYFMERKEKQKKKD